MLLFILAFLAIQPATAQTLLTESFDGTWPETTGWTIFNAGPGNPWAQSLNSWDVFLGAGCMKYSPLYSYAADSWSFSPDISMTSGEKYMVEFYQRVAYPWSPEKMKVTCGQGKDVAAQTIVIWDNSGEGNLVNDAYVKRLALFTCPLSGNYNFAFHAYSDAYSYGMMVDEVRIFIPVVANATPVDFAATSVTVNSMNISWKDNSTNETAFRVYRSTDNINFTQAGGDVPSTTTAETGGTYSLSQTSLVQGTTYYYRVAAVVDMESPYLTGNQATLVPSISGLKKIGPNAGDDYPSLTSAFGDIVIHGVAGPVWLELQSGYSGATDEPAFPVVIPMLPYADSINTVTVYPAVAALTIRSNSAEETIRLDGAMHVTFDGRAGGTGEARDLVIQNTNPMGSTIRFVNGACYNSFKFCDIQGVNAGTGGIVYFSTTNGTTGNDHNTIGYCDLGGDGTDFPVHVIYSFGTVNVENNHNTISNNNIFDFRGVNASGIYIFSQTDDWGLQFGAWTITGNSLYQRTPYPGVNGTTVYGINIEGSSFYNPTYFTVSGNYIGGSAPHCGGDPWTITGTPADFRFLGIHLNVGMFGQSSIQNNTIAHFNWTSTSGASRMPGVWCGIFVDRGCVKIGNETGNTVGSGSGTGSIIVTTSTTGGASFGIGCGQDTYAFISHNTIGSLTLAGNVTSVSHSFYGIYYHSGGNRLDHNLIGSTVTANSINCITSSVSDSAQSLYGICVNKTLNNYPDTIAFNTVANLNNNYANPAAVSGLVCGIFSSNYGIIGWNTVRNLTTTSPNPGTLEHASVIGIESVAYLNQTITGNTIYDLFNTSASGSAVEVCGICYKGRDYFWGSGAVDTIERNFVHSLGLSGSSNDSRIYGIQGGAGYQGSAVFKNNLVRLGIDGDGNSITTGYDIRGMNEINADSATNHFYFNSIYVGGTGVNASSSNTCAFFTGKLPSQKKRNYLDNIFVNARSNSSGTASHYAFSLPSADTCGLVSDYNLYYGTSSAGLFQVASSGYNSLQLFRGSLAGQDLHSGVGDPGFVNPGGTRATVSLHLSATTPAESAGMPVAGVTNDFDGQDRSTLSATDIGADAGDFTPLDIFTPTISYAPLPMTAYLANRTLANVNISDVGTGVPLSGTLVPRIWYWRSAPTQSSWTSTAGTLMSGNGNNGTWSFTIDYSLLDRLPEVGDTYGYYVVAQDLAISPNIWYQPFAGASHTDVNNVISASSVPDSYPIVIPISGNFDVGPGHSFTSLTADDNTGVFKMINSSLVSGNITIKVRGDLAEPGTVELNRMLEEPVGLGFTLTIQPDEPVERLISGGVSPGLIRFNGASHIIIDGQSGQSGRYLRFRNTDISGSSFILKNDACFNSIRNCFIEGNNASDSPGGVFLFSTTTGITGNDYNTITGCSLRDRSDITGYPANLICSYGTKGKDNSSNTIINNELSNYTLAAVTIGDEGSYWNISGNSIYNQLPSEALPGNIGIRFLYVENGFGNPHPSFGNVISGNHIGGQAALCGGEKWNIPQGFLGIHILRWQNPFEITMNGNTIQNIGFTGDVQNGFFGFRVKGGSNIIMNGNTIGHESIPGSISLPNGTFYGVYINYGALSFTNNTIANIILTDVPGLYNWASVSALNASCDGPVLVKGNFIHDITQTTSSSYFSSFDGLAVFNATIVHVEDNSVYNLASNSSAAVNSASMAGMKVWVAGGSILRNKVYNLVNLNQGTNGFLNGIDAQFYQYPGIIANNTVSVGEGSGNSVNIIGLKDQSYADLDCAFNSVNVSGAATSGQPFSYAFKGQVPATNNKFRNNIFSNLRTGTGKHFAIGMLGTQATMIADKNDLYTASGPFGKWGDFGADQPDLNAWRTVSLHDSNSVSVDPLFFSLNDLHPANSALNDIGIYLPQVPEDFDGNPRTNPPDIGAFEFGNDPVVATMDASGIGGTAATLNGSVSANDKTLAVWFDYGPTTAYGSSAGAVPGSVSGIGTTSVSAGILNLPPGTVCHFRARGITLGGLVVYGRDRSFTTQDVPLNATIQNVDVLNGGLVCHEAVHTLEIAGGGTSYTVESGGSAKMVAAQNILYHPGTRVFPGGYMHGYITANGQFCATQPANPVVTNPVKTGEQTESADGPTNSQAVRIYPNPAGSSFTAEVTGDHVSGLSKVDIYNSGGMMMFTRVLQGERKREFSVSSFPPGIYFVQVHTDTGIETMKLIKL